jgi:beta-glucosidase
MRLSRWGLLLPLFVLTHLAVAQDTPEGPDARARRVEGQMTDDERFTLLHGVMALQLSSKGDAAPLDLGELPGAGYIAGIPRLGIPALHETDASLGITNPMGVRSGDTATALPSGLALGASFDRALARRAGEMLGREARAKGFNVLLGGGVNLIRDPRNGRNFEYLSEDPLLSGVLAGEEVLGTQAQGVVSTVKHYALNANETNRQTLDAVIDPGALRESDLLAFQIAIERGRPGSVMCAYNQVNGVYACGNGYLQNEVLKRDWGYPGWVMSDWGAVRSADYAAQGLDQESGSQLDRRVWFDGPLKEAVAAGRVSRERISNMVRRILRSVYAVGVDRPASGSIDLAADSAVALDEAREGIVLLKNEGILPLAGSVKSIAVIGGHANIGVLSGGGSSQVTPPGGYAATIPYGGEGQMSSWRTERFSGVAPLAELAKRVPGAHVLYDPGLYPTSAARLAQRADVAIVFVTKFEVEGYDSPDLALPEGQDALIAAVAAANPNTVVVLETGNPIVMPWRERVKGVVAAWYPGQAGGQAIAEMLTGTINPSGRLPVSFPAGVQDLPRPQLPGFGTPEGTPTTFHYSEGSDVGYRWFAKMDRAPLYPFGYGLSYTRFSYSGLRVIGGDTVTARFVVRNEGERAGAAVPQLYLVKQRGAGTLRLLGFERVTLEPGASREVRVEVDPRLLASFDSHAEQWRIDGGVYDLRVTNAAGMAGTEGSVRLKGRRFAGVRWRRRCGLWKRACGHEPGSGRDQGA